MNLDSSFMRVSVKVHEGKFGNSFEGPRQFNNWTVDAPLPLFIDTDDWPRHPSKETTHIIYTRRSPTARTRSHTIAHPLPAPPPVVVEVLCVSRDSRYILFTQDREREREREILSPERGRIVDPDDPRSRIQPGPVDARIRSTRSPGALFPPSPR